MMKCEVINIDGARNVRDLGGYATKNGLTKKRRFIRAASLSNLTPAGVDSLIQLGIDCVVDLRSVYEFSANPDVVAGHPKITNLSVPMLDHIISNMVSGAEDYPESMPAMYIGLLESGKADIKQLFEIFTRPFNTFLFHCTAGKDRTGVCAMLLLGLAGVDDETIAEDYGYTRALSEKVNRPNHLPAFLFDANPDAMLDVIAYLKEKYGGITQYLESAGLTAEQLDIVRKKLVE